MRILVADDKPEICSALRLLLEQEPWVTVVGEASEANGLLVEMQSSSPDVVFVDWELPDLPPGEALERLHYLRPNLVLIALSVRPEVREKALAAGADAFISKGEPPEALLKTLRSFTDAGTDRPGVKTCPDKPD